jgi:hypothetical protein
LKRQTATIRLWIMSHCIGSGVNRWLRRTAHHRRATQQGHAPRWEERGMGERFSRAEQLEHRVQMLLGIFSAKGVLPIEFEPARSVGDLLTQHLDELECEAED